MINITKGTNSDCKRLLRSTMLSFNEVSSTAENKSKSYNMTFSISLSEPIVNASPETVKTALDKIARAIAVFGEQDFLNVSMEIIEHGSVEYHIASKAVESYNASRKLEGLTSEEAK